MAKSREFRAILAGLMLLFVGFTAIAGADPRLRTDHRKRSIPTEIRKWPSNSSPERQKADFEADIRFQGVLKGMGSRFGSEAVVRTRYFRLAGDLSREERTRLGTLLDGQVRRMNERRGASIDDEPFPTRIGVFAAGSRDRFQLLEAGQFDRFAPSDRVAGLHIEGSTLLLSVDFTAVRGRLDYQLSRAVAEAWLYGFGTNRPLPAWAEEGFTAATAWSEAPPGTGYGRREAIESVRRGRGLEDLLLLEEEWSPNPSDEARAGLLMERLLDRPDTLFAWFDAVKAGEPWRQAFERIFESTPEELVDYTVRWYRVND